MKFFAKLAGGFGWIGKEIGEAVMWLPKVVKISDDVKNDAETLLPELAQVVEDVAGLAKAAVKDSASDLVSAEALLAAIMTAYNAKALNVAADFAVVSAFETFIKTVTKTSNYADVLEALKKLVVDYDKFGGSAKMALMKLEEDCG